MIIRPQTGYKLIPGGPKNEATLHSVEYLENYIKDIYIFLHISRLVYTEILNRPNKYR